jgi:hypothetical protein
MHLAVFVFFLTLNDLFTGGLLGWYIHLLLSASWIKHAGDVMRPMSSWFY